MLDKTDQTILSILQENARTSNAEIARQIGVAPSCICERIKKLEQRGTLAGYHAAVNPQELGYGVTAFLFIKTEDKVGATASAKELAEIPEVLEVHQIAGEDCYLAKVRCADNADLGRLLREEIGAIETVISSRTSIVMETIKETNILPVERHQEVAR